MMTILKDVVLHNPSSTQGAAVLLRDGLFDDELVKNFSPTQSSVEVLKVINEAVLPDAAKDLRAMNWFGSYGAGKSHLATLVGQLLRDGASNGAFSEFLDKLQNLGFEQLANNIKDNFPSSSKPYLIVPLYGSQTPSLAAKLMEGLYKSIGRLCHSEPDLEIKDILPKTEYDVAISRLQEILVSDPGCKAKILDEWGVGQHYYDLEELEECLLRHEPEALFTFRSWHKKVCHGASFQPQNDGGKGFVEAYKEAAQNLKERGYAGIAVIWDEFGNALEDLLGTPERNPVGEIIELQRFVETVCEPSRGHTVFIGCTHASMGEYGTRSKANLDVQERLETIEGRFTPIKIALKSSEVEGYNLLSAQTRWTHKGKILLNEAEDRLTKLTHVLEKLSLFSPLSSEIISISKGCYPLHPVTAAGLFAISTQYAQATRTAFTFFRDMNSSVWDSPISENGVFSTELVRLPTLLDYYSDSLQKKSSSEYQKYRKALAEVRASENSDEEYADLLKVIFLSTLLGDNFQSSDLFLSIALRDSFPDSAIDLLEKLAWLQKAGLIWKNDMTEVWSFSGESGVDIESLIKEKVKDITAHTPEVLFANDTVLREDILPVLGTHNLAPSSKGIVRSYHVSLVTAPFDIDRYPKTSTLSSARVFFVLAKDKNALTSVIGKCHATPLLNGFPVYFWVSSLCSDLLAQKCKRYSVLTYLIADNTHSEGVRQQLKAKLEQSRHELICLINNSFGREGLDSGNTTIILGGEADPITCSSWHTFEKEMVQHVSLFYNEEVPVRSRTFNELGSDQYVGKKKVISIINRILNMKNNRSYQNDLLGFKNTSQESAIVDGLLGKFSNDLFIERDIGFDLKNVDEVNGTLRDLLELIRRTFMTRRDNAYHVNKLREKLLAPPYGVPPNAQAIFAAVAIRNDYHRLEFVGKTTGSFEEILSKSFLAGSPIKIRVQDFTTKQRDALILLAGVLAVQRQTNTDELTFLRLVIQTLKSKINSLPVSITKSPDLDQGARLLVSSVEAVGKPIHDIANVIVEISSINKQISKLRLIEIFNQFEKLADARLFSIRDELKILLPEDRLERKEVLEKCRDQNKQVMCKELFDLLLKEHLDEDDLERLVYLVVDVSLRNCTDIEVGRFVERLRNLLTIVEPSKTFKPDSPHNEPFGGGKRESDNSVNPSGVQLSPDSLEEVTRGLFEYVRDVEMRYGRATVSSAVKSIYQRYSENY